MPGVRRHLRGQPPDGAGVRPVHLPPGARRHREAAIDRVGRRAGVGGEGRAGPVRRRLLRRRLRLRRLTSPGRDGTDLTRPVPTCPEWTLRQLITHVGRAHRWAAAIVTTRSPVPIPFREVPDGKLPGNPRGHAGWLRTGAAGVVGAVRAAGDEQVWTHPGPGPARY